MKPRTPLTLDDIEAGYDDERWLGFGYLGVRREAMGRAKGRKVMADLDVRVLAHANANRWTPADLFYWLNSKRGRWLAESFLYGPEGTRERDFHQLLVKE